MGRVSRQEGHPECKKPLLQKTMIMLTESMAPSTWRLLNEPGVRRIPRLVRHTDEERAGTMVKVCTVNVGTLKGRSREVVDMLSRRGADICCLQETRYRNQGCTVFGSNEEKYKFWYSGNGEGVGGVGIMMKNIMTESVIEVVRLSDRLMKIEMVLGRCLYHIFSALC